MPSSEDLKQVISGFLHCTPEEIKSDTIINRDALKNSIIVHRMYAELASNGFLVEDYSSIKTFSDLENALSTGGSTIPDNSFHTIQNIKFTDKAGVGIDVEEVDNFPNVADFREDPFYKQNFSEHEISHCILKANPKASFAGLFAAKESIVKANPDLKDIPFSKIEIQHNSIGKPNFSGFSISISHTEKSAVAVAITNTLNQTNDFQQNAIQSKSFGKLGILVVVLIFISILNLLALIFHWFKV